MATERTSIAGLMKPDALPTPPARRIPAAPTTPAVAPQPARPAPASTPPAPSRTSGRRGRRADPRPNDVVPDDAQVSVNLSLPTKLCTLTRDRSKADDNTIATTLMDAIVATYDRLPELIQALQRKRSKDILFIRIAPASKEERSQLPFRMLGANLKTIDSLVEKFGADDRSQLCAAALGGYLDYDFEDSDVA